MANRFIERIQVDPEQYKKDIRAAGYSYEKLSEVVDRSAELIADYIRRGSVPRHLKEAIDAVIYKEAKT